MIKQTTIVVIGRIRVKWDWMHLIDFLPGELTFVTSYLHFCTAICKFFPFKEDPFSQGNKSNLEKVISPESVSVPIKMATVTERNINHKFICHLGQGICHYIALPGIQRPTPIFTVRVWPVSSLSSWLIQYLDLELIICVDSSRQKT